MPFAPSSVLATNNGHVFTKQKDRAVTCGATNPPHAASLLSADSKGNTPLGQVGANDPLRS